MENICVNDPLIIVLKHKRIKQEHGSLLKHLYSAGSFTEENK